MTGSPDNIAHLIGNRAFRFLEHNVTDYMHVEGALDGVLHFASPASPVDYLELPIQTLKLDREFVRDIETDENDAAISAATLALAHELGLRVVAEGIETEGQSRFLRAHGCDLLQGYLYGRPEPAEFWTARWSEGGAAGLKRTRNHSA